jgi:hypothetical protein
MTINDYITRRKWVIGGTVLPLCFVALVGLLAGRHAWGNVAAYAWFFGFVALALVLRVVLVAQTRCPRCGGRLLVGSGLGGPSSVPPGNTCPHCEVSLDEPMDVKS